MDIDSSPSESDCIDDTGCEDLFQSSYWDINYVQAIENEDGPENEEYSDNEEGITPHVRPLSRIRYHEMNESGEFVQEDYYNQEEEDSSEEDSSEDEKESSESDELVLFWVHECRCEKEVPLTDEEKRIRNKMRTHLRWRLYVDEMGLNTEQDELYDPSLDEKDEIGSSQQHCMTFNKSFI